MPPNDLLTPLMLAYLLLGFGLLVLCLATAWRWWVKAGMVLLTTGFYFVAQQGFALMAGWPSADALPQRFVLLSAVFDEPSPGRGHAGAIHIWVHPIEDNAPLALPRAHRLPYEKDLHRLLNDGLKKAREGNTQIGSAHTRPGPGGLPWLRGNAEKVEIRLSDLPRAQLPEK